MAIAATAPKSARSVNCDGLQEMGRDDIGA